VPAVAALQVAAFEHEMLDPPHIQQVVQPELVVGGLVEGAVDDAQLGVVEVGGQDAVLVVLETAVADFQRALLHADAGAIAIGHAGAAEGDVVHLEVPVHEHPDPLAFRVASVGLEHRPGAQAADFEGFLGPHGHIAPIGAGLDEDGVAVPGEARGVGDARHALVRADDDHRGGRGGAGREQRRGDKAPDAAQQGRVAGGPTLGMSPFILETVVGRACWCVWACSAITLRVSVCEGTKAFAHAIL
jgi:hypothetical protein